MQTLYVDPGSEDPDSGDDHAHGNRRHPFRTLTTALKRAQPQTIIQLLPGTYNPANGEMFPLIVPPGVIIIGDERNHGQHIAIEGNGLYYSHRFQQQNVTLILGDRSQLRGITLSNRAPKGIGIWIETASPTVINTTISRCTLAGIAVIGGKPQIQNNRITHNGSAGIFLRRNAKGEIIRNNCHATGYGITLSDDSAPLVADNTCTGNQVGIYLSHRVQPVLRRNRFAENQTAGLVAKEAARPDLGHPQDPGRNIFRDNGRYDLHNATSHRLLISGNDLAPQRIQGLVDLAPVEVEQGSLGPSQFGDVGGHWAAAFIEALVERQLLRGFPDGSFRPDGRLTRAEFAALIAQSFDLPRQLGTRRSFRDVAADFWGGEAIAKAAQMGFIAGYEDGTFRPQQNLTRVQAVVALVNGLGLAGANLESLGAYQDRALIPSYATAAVAIAIEKRLLATYPDPHYCHPQRDITRAEVAVFLYQALVTMGTLPPLFSPYLVNPDPYLPTFQDIRGHWAEPFLRRLSGGELISGFSDGTFRPDDPINRAQYAALLVRILNPAPIRPGRQFLDVLPEFWGQGAIVQAYRGGFLSGFPDQTFHPDQRLQRIHLIVSLASGLGLAPGDEAILSQYPDGAEIPTYARGAVAAATIANLIVRPPEQRDLAPKQEASRAEAAVMLYQALVYAGTLLPIPSPHLVRFSR